ncbi:sugar MFS transporter [Sphingomonas sp. RB1R13]|jgi:FHS family L-fucose permease-like MFS transporter|uniref:sugar MFS transporter n=1 Tax=Sphingomonas sp. RB1R13 TaxID=3096159 RepID=UPI002FCC996D
MALAPAFSEAEVSPLNGSSAGDPPANARSLQWYVFGLFFIFGGITSLNDVLIPKLKELYSLNYFQAMLIQFAFFAAYAIISMPGAALVKKLGYMRTAVVGLLTMAAGCLLFIPAASSSLYIAFLGALFVLASGVVIVQVVANPLISMLGPKKTTSSRLTFAQAFNSLGTTVFPLVGATIILGSLATIDPATLSGMALDAYRAAESQAIVRTYLALAAALGLLALLVFLGRNRLVEQAAPTTNLLASFDLLKQTRFAFGAACIFLYVGAEVSIGSVLVNYLKQADTLGGSTLSAGRLVAFYWGGAMVGRFIGSALLRVIRPGLVLLGVATGAILLVAISALTLGVPSGYALLAVGLMNSIMFPTIFSLASEELGPRAADGSGIICVAIVGGAIVPAITGLVADATTLRSAMIVPVLCYAVIAAFGLWCANRARAAA